MARGNRDARAFTLVELLVVIGIIALLISILLPSLNRARRQANTLKGLANLQQMGLGLRLYCGVNRDYLPPGEIDYANGDYAYWYHFVNAQLNRTAGPSNGETPTGGLSKIFVDPNGTVADKTNYYSCNGIAMPDYSRFTIPSPYIPKTYKISKCKATTVLVVDGTQYPALDFQTYPVLLAVDSGRICLAGYSIAQSYQNQWYLEGNPYPQYGVQNGDPVYPGLNADVDNDSLDIRFRQIDPTPGSKRGAANTLFADGHAVTVTQGDMKRFNFLMPNRN